MHTKYKQLISGHNRLKFNKKTKLPSEEYVNANFKIFKEQMQQDAYFHLEFKV
jgi:hypothetical protein